MIFIRETVEKDLASVIGLLQCLSSFAPKKNDYPYIWEAFNEQKNLHSVVATLEEEVVGYGSVLIETKIRGGKAGHIEDVVSHQMYRGMGIGKALIDALYVIAENKECYKVTLQCREQNQVFYKKCGYANSGITMQKFLKK
jgi:glucosamine-phosphate N-acetyltransferase